VAVSLHPIETELRHAGCEIDASVSFYRERLQGDRAMGSPDERVGSDARADGDIGTHPDIRAG
jgi:hypothetical protein